VSELIACTGAPLAGPHAVIAARVPRVTIRDISTAEDLAALEPLWLSLHHHHHVIGPSEHLVNDDATSWERRRAVYEGWLRSGTAIVLVAHLPCTGPAGYLVAHVCQGPDDTFAVGDRYAELYSLSVAPAHRCRGIGTSLLDVLDQRLEALAIHDLTVAVMVRNDDALRLYQARGLARTEITLWRLGRSR
jgi:ribosomal protein S18 acetylase RimI-like enzyme